MNYQFIIDSESKHGTTQVALQHNLGTAYYHSTTEISSGTNCAGYFRENCKTGEKAYMTEYNKSTAYIRPVRRFWKISEESLHRLRKRLDKTDFLQTINPKIW